VTVGYKKDIRKGHCDVYVSRMWPGVQQGRSTWRSPPASARSGRDLEAEARWQFECESEPADEQARCQLDQPGEREQRPPDPL